MQSEAALLWGLLFGSIGLGYFVYGKRQKRAVPLLVGVGLMGAPYLVSNSLLLVLLSMVLMVLPYFL